MVLLKDVLAILVIGDGLSAAVFPRARVRRWARGPAVLRRSAEALDRRPGVTRALGAAGAAAGLWWTARLPSRPER